jgi:hypothetical protein
MSCVFEVRNQLSTTFTFFIFDISILINYNRINEDLLYCHEYGETLDRIFIGNEIIVTTI